MDDRPFHGASPHNCVDDRVNTKLGGILCATEYPEMLLSKRSFNAQR